MERKMKNFNEIWKIKSSKIAFPRQILGAWKRDTQLCNKVDMHVTSDDLTA